MGWPSDGGGKSLWVPGGGVGRRTAGRAATSEENLLVSVVITDDDLTRIAAELSELGLAVSNEQLIRGERFGAYRGFAGGTTDEK